MHHGIYLSLLFLSLSSAYTSQIVPSLVFKCDEATLDSLSDHTQATPLTTLLKDSLPATMALILTNHAQQDKHDSEEGSEERRKKASEAHKLLVKHLTQEVYYWVKSVCVIYTV